MPERFLGRTLGKYRVDEVIGSGGFAWVYRGYDPELEIPVAIKVLKPQFAGDPAFEERFRREASTAAKLRHPNIIKIYSVGKEGDAVFFVMDYLPTGLADKLEKTPTLPEEFVLRVGIDVARALGFAHREGVIHRDIKVDNIMFDVHGNAVVADFGIARAVSGHKQQTGTNMVVGTPQYFAPEQARAKPLDGRADIYSLGVTLYRSATGRLPFDGEDWYEIARQHVEEPAPPPTRFNSALSSGLERVLLRCLAKHPDDRPVTGEELADELAAILDGRRQGSAARSLTMAVSPSSAPTVIATASIGTRASRRVAVVTVLAVAALGAAAVPLLARWRTARETPPVAPAAPPADTVAMVAPPVSDTTARPDTSSARLSPTNAPSVPARRDTAARAAANVLRLSVTAPNDAHLSVNGVSVGDGHWRADTLKPAEYVLVATVDAIDGCESARDEQSVRLRPGAPRDVVLAPRGCGTVAIEGQPPGAHYVITSGDGTIKREGQLPLDGTLVLPVGSYHLTANKPQCAQFEQDFALAAGQAMRIPFRMICATPSPDKRD
ncbi:MAG: Serine/threonine-protein kinase PknD [Gemmatimonadaceae bacterium]|nr:Serine/threonine-protein kinase PknD [Gemmatimonadaceae bacterium]